MALVCVKEIGPWIGVVGRHEIAMRIYSIEGREALGDGGDLGYGALTLAHLEGERVGCRIAAVDISAEDHLTLSCRGIHNEVEA